MDDIPFSIQDLWQALCFLAEREGLEPKKFTLDILRQKQIQEEKMNDLLQLFATLDEGQKRRLLHKLGIAGTEQKTSSPPPIQAQSREERKYLLSQLKDLEVADLVKIKPKKMWINGAPHEVKNWKEVAINFVRALLAQNILRKEDLPFYPNPASGKAYVNSFPSQPVSSYDGLFEKVEDGFYVDIKHNVKYHILNMWRTLEKLGLQDKWNVELELRD